MNIEDVEKPYFLQEFDEEYKNFDRIKKSIRDDNDPDSITKKVEPLILRYGISKDSAPFILKRLVAKEIENFPQFLIIALSFHNIDLDKRKEL